MSEEKIRYIYCITNLVNGKNYFGQHTMRNGYKTELADMYWGSGKILKLAQKKYGLENFKKEIIISGKFSKEQINRFEKCTIRINKFLGKAEYNIAPGGEGFGSSDFAKYVRSFQNTKEFKKQLSKKLKSYWKEHPEAGKLHALKAKETNRKSGYNHATFKGKHHSEITKAKLSEIAKAQGRGGNPNGLHWFTNGKDVLHCKECPEGYVPGKTIKIKIKKGYHTSSYECIETKEVKSNKDWYSEGFKDVVNVSKTGGTCKGFHFRKI